MTQISNEAQDVLSSWIHKVEGRLEQLWKLVNGNGAVGVWETLRDMQDSLNNLHTKVDTLAKHSDLQRLRADFEAHTKMEGSLLAAAQVVRKLRPVWRWLIALISTALASGSLGAWLNNG